MNKPTTVTGEIPKGFRLTGEFRCPKKGEWHLQYGEAWLATRDYEHCRYFILEKLPKKKRKGRGKK